MGSKWLETFMEYTDEYQKETNAKQQIELKDKVLSDSWHLCYRETVIRQIITADADILANHKHDNCMMKCDEKYKGKKSKVKMTTEVLLQMKPVLHNLVEKHVIVVERKIMKSNTSPKGLWVQI